MSVRLLLGPQCAAGAARQRRQDAACSLPVTPARTCSEAAIQARNALRRFRDAVTIGEAGAPAAPLRLTVRLPLPSPSREDDALHNYDDSDWPGGTLQRFRRLRPLVEEQLLSGYDPEFVGMLESPADGIGVWRAAGGSTTVVAQVGNPNFAPFVRLCAGEFGGAVLDAGHTLIAVNPTWTQSKDIGQLWDKKLRQQAATLIDDSDAWLPLYYLGDTRTAKGATGLLFRAWPHDWQLYHTTANEEEPAGALDAPPVLVSAGLPPREQQIEALNAALAAQRQLEKEGKLEARKARKWF